MVKMKLSGFIYRRLVFFYGITLGLITVNALATFNDVSAQVDREAASISSFYRKVSNYPEPTRSILQSQTRSYTSYIIDKAWQLQRKGVDPVDAVKQIVAIEKNLDSFEPTTESQKSLHNITLISFDDMSKQARLRLQNVENGLPDILWAVVFLGHYSIFL